MQYRFSTHVSAVLAILATGCAGTFAQQAGPQPGYFDLPAGFDFPADKQTLEQYRTSGNLSAQRAHVWNVFAGMTQPTPDGKHAIFETWYSEREAFATGAVPQALGPRPMVFRFTNPRQLQGKAGQPAPQAAGSELLSEVMYNYPNYNHIRSNRLYLFSKLQDLQQSGASDPHIPNDKTVPPFPKEAISLKTVWWPVAKDKPTPMPIWDPELNPANNNGNPYTTWVRAVVVDPTRQNIPENETMTVSFHGQHPNSRVYGLDRFHYVIVDDQTAANAMSNGRLRQFVNDVLHRDLQAGDYALFVGTHLTTKEIDDWVWATFWWHDRPDAGSFAADRPDSVKGVWRNYLMSASYDLNLPREQDGSPHIAFNPWLEAGFRKLNGGDGSGLQSNCMNCHLRAAAPQDTFGFLPIFRGDPKVQTDPAYAPGLLRTDFLWSITDLAQ
ncbi:MAG: hypothetical protein QOC72_1501 [Methylobacteriaceae bacterium]|jgi:hypothetical protein|nr:hypothetical protein [Methylobacteriaceae bacterium]